MIDALQRGIAALGDFIWFGTMLGAGLGLAHALYFIATRLGRPGTRAAGVLWHGLWIWGLWALFGAYVLFFWLLGLVSYVAVRATGGGRVAAR